MLSRRLLFVLSAGSVYIPHQALALRTNADAADPTKLGGMDCSIPACHSKAEMFKAAMHRAKATGKSGQKEEGTSNDRDSGNTTAGTSAQRYNEGCPVDKDELGIGTWNLLHTIAATYKDNPSEQEQDMMVKFFETLSLIYPCPHCAEVK